MAATTARAAVSMHRARDTPPSRRPSRVRSAAPVPRRVLHPTTGLPTRTSERGDVRHDVVISAHRTGRPRPARATGARDEVVPSVAVAPPDADEVDVLVRYVYPGVRFSQGKVVVLRARKTGGADRADPVDDAAAADDDDDEGDGILGSASAAGSAPATVTGADVVAALRRDGVDVARWRPRVALRLGDLDPAAAAARAKTRMLRPGHAAATTRGGGDRSCRASSDGARSARTTSSPSTSAPSVSWCSSKTRSSPTPYRARVIKKRQSLARRFPRRGRRTPPSSPKGPGGRNGGRKGEESGDEDEPPREGEGEDEPPRAPSASAPRTISADGAATTMTR